MAGPTNQSVSALPELTIDDALVRFLDAQRSRLALRTFRRYEEICDLLRHCLNGGHTGLSGLELKRWERAYEAGDEEAFCGSLTLPALMSMGVRGTIGA